MGGASWWVGLAVVQRLKCIDGHRLGPSKVAVIRSRQVAADQGFLKHCEMRWVAVKRGSTVCVWGGGGGAAKNKQALDLQSGPYNGYFIMVLGSS